MFKRFIRVGFDFSKLIFGLMVYLVSKRTLAFSYQSMIRLFCATQGHSNDVLSFVIGLIKRPYNFGKDADGILGCMSGRARQLVVADLRTQGYHVFTAKIPEQLCDKLLEYALTKPCISRPMDGQGRQESEIVIYPRENPSTVRYDFTPQDLLSNEDVQGLLADMSFSAIAQDYLGARPVIDVLSMWWHTAFSDKPDMEAAQYYHFDMDRPKWLKFFIYLTDVTSASGAHVFVKESQRTGGIPSSMLKKGYARLTDEEVENHYGCERVIEYIASRGTIIAEDTRGLHKGKHVKCGDRLVLQIQFSNCLFGAAHSSGNLKSPLRSDLQVALLKYPSLYSLYR